MHLERKRAISLDAYHAEFGIAHHDRVGGAPLDARELFHADEIYVERDRRLERVFPARELGKYREYLRIEIVRTCGENIAEAGQ